MKQYLPYGFSELNPIGRYTFLSKISQILDSEDHAQNLIIAIYLLGQKKFFYSNRVFQKLLGTKLPRFYADGWDFWFANMWKEDSEVIRLKINNFLELPFEYKPLTLRYHIYDGNGADICLKHEMVLYRKQDLTFVINYLFDVTHKERIDNCIKAIPNCSDYKRSTDIKPISAREEEVLKLIADGYSSKQIADLLCISNHTAISHRKHLIEKFRVRNTAQLIKKASKIIEL
ncbi:MAG: helix-turn-helix transcriptional regulator [Flavobacteriaceae bacterium]